jgi:curved DNA-binding protein CbpA
MQAEGIGDYYSVLEVSRKATPEEIRTAFKRLARTHHPDRRGGKIGDYGEIFKAVNAAYTIRSGEKGRIRPD